MLWATWVVPGASFGMSARLVPVLWFHGQFEDAAVPNLGGMLRLEPFSRALTKWCQRGCAIPPKRLFDHDGTVAEHPCERTALGRRRPTGLAGPGPRRRRLPGRGTLFDNDHKVCPRQTRLRSGRIADLSPSRDAGEEDKVHAAWTVTNPGNRRPAANACRASLVAILDDNDGSPIARSLSPGARRTAFDQVGIGTGGTVRPAIVMEAADGDCPISDILEQTPARA